MPNHRLLYWKQYRGQMIHRMHIMSGCGSVWYYKKNGYWFESPSFNVSALPLSRPRMLELFYVARWTFFSIISQSVKWSDPLSTKELISLNLWRP